MEQELLHKYDYLCNFLKEAGPVGVAFSGGADSTFLLKAAVDTLGKHVPAFYADSVLQPSGERESALALAGHLGCELIVIKVDPLSWQSFSQNPPDRCYHCKKKIYTLFLEKLQSRGVDLLIDGTNLDDLSEDRPGLRAIDELEVSMPLVQAKLAKKEIRMLSRYLSLPNWDKKSASCLATRIHTGEPITANNVEMVRKGEDFLSSLGFSGCRVRLGRGRVFLELIDDSSERLIQKALKEKVTKFFTKLGFDKIYLDLVERPGI